MSQNVLIMPSIPPWNNGLFPKAPCYPEPSLCPTERKWMLKRCKTHFQLPRILLFPGNVPSAWDFMNNQDVLQFALKTVVLKIRTFLKRKRNSSKKRSSFTNQSIVYLHSGSKFIGIQSLHILCPFKSTRVRNIYLAHATSHLTDGIIFIFLHPFDHLSFNGT